jgi:outer membrane lipoprotein
MKFYILLISLLLSACSALPSVFSDARIKDVAYAELLADAESYTNTMVRWGGVIIGLENEASQSTLKVMFYPLDYYGRPDFDSASAGYFVIKSPERLDPGQYTEGRGLVAVGIVEGRTVSSSGHDGIGLPVIKASSIHLWPVAYRNNYYWHCPSCYFQQLYW